MSKQEKKGKKGKKKKEGQKVKSEERMTFAEALLAFQIQHKEASIASSLIEVRQIEEKNKRYKERNERLKEEQMGYIRNILNEAKERDKELAKKEVVKGEEVDEAIREKWEFIRNNEQLLEDLRSQVHDLDKKIMEKQIEKEYWLEYKNVGSKDHAKQIQLLEAEILKIKEIFQDIKEHFRKTLESMRNDIARFAEKHMDSKKEDATEYAIKHIDKISRQEIKENDWLNKEVVNYRKDVYDLEFSVHQLEKENIEFINHLFDCRLQNLNISRHLFLTQAACLKIPKDKLLEKDLQSLEYETIDIKHAKPKSPILIAAQEKVLSFDAQQPSKKEELKTNLLESLSQDLTDVLYGDGKDLQEYLQLGPLELKLLSTVGRAVPIHKKGEDTSVDEYDEDTFEHTKPKWPITYELIKSTFP
ncbi:coiled-coil domain-containing protein 83 [Rhinatrema bivittatum]|uniref:coiled-coil domain-containing protein 83 n=1 Tax=Rhinatrema bivittatum TaxID=194408 RepID=UPI001127FFA6|nr:coiled-coil domain-containing protein 83 [Rhinatrema bivittatum]XP_029458120.1 coiled-coil domain-containing protein 83 [Rhinatrema bivittatum]